MGKLSQGLIYGGNIAGYFTNLGSPVTATLFGISRLTERALEQKKKIRIGDNPYLRLAKVAATLFCASSAMREYYGSIDGFLDGWFSIALALQIGSEAHESYLGTDKTLLSDLRIVGRDMRRAGREISDVVRDLRK